MFAYSTSYHRCIKTTTFEVTFVLELRTNQNTNPDLRRQFGENMGTVTFQILQVCQNLTLKIASINNDHSIEESTKYFNSKVKPVEFKEDDWVLIKKTQFSSLKLKTDRNL
jgi:hypothetical protein